MSDKKDPYLYPGTDTLINNAGIRDKKQLEEFERDTVALNLSQLEESPIIGPFDKQSNSFMEWTPKNFQSV